MVLVCAHSLTGLDLEVVPKLVFPVGESSRELDPGATLGVSTRTEGRYGWGFGAGLEAGGLPGRENPSQAFWAFRLGPSWQANLGEAWVWDLGGSVGLARASLPNLSAGTLHLWLAGRTSLRYNFTPGVGFALGVEYQSPTGLYRAVAVSASFVVEGVE